MEERSGDDIHLNDTLQELMSLSARFGMTITFQKPDKDGYLAISEASGEGIWTGNVGGGALYQGRRLLPFARTAEAPELQSILWKRSLQNCKKAAKKEVLRLPFSFIYFITAPVFAEETSFAYLESQPVVTFGAGAT